MKNDPKNRFDLKKEILKSYTESAEIMLMDISSFFDDIMMDNRDDGLIYTGCDHVMPFSKDHDCPLCMKERIELLEGHLITLSITHPHLVPWDLFPENE